MPAMRTLLALACVALLAAAAHAHAAGALLSGSIRSAQGEKMGGVTVSAKPQGGTITTTVFTDEAGEYFFPPLEPGKYRLWAQALGYRTSRSDVDASSKTRQDFTLARMTSAEAVYRQLPGHLMLASLPEDNQQDRRMKRLVRNECTGCHTASYPL